MPRVPASSPDRVGICEDYDSDRVGIYEDYDSDRVGIYEDYDSDRVGIYEDYDHHSPVTLFLRRRFPDPAFPPFLPPPWFISTTHG